MTTGVPESNSNGTEQQIPKVEQLNTTPETPSDLSAQIDGQKGTIATTAESLVSGDQQLAAKMAADPSADPAAVSELTAGLGALDTEAQAVSSDGEAQLNAIADGQTPTIAPATAEGIANREDGKNGEIDQKRQQIALLEAKLNKAQNEYARDRSVANSEREIASREKPTNHSDGVPIDFRTGYNDMIANYDRYYLPMASIEAAEIKGQIANLKLEIAIAENSDGTPETRRAIVESSIREQVKQASIERAQGLVTGGERRIATLQNDIARYQQLRTQKEAELTAYQNDVASLRSQVQQKEGDQNLQERLDSARSNGRAVQGEYNRIDDRLGQLNADLQDQLPGLQRRIEEGKATLAEIQNNPEPFSKLPARMEDDPDYADCTAEAEFSTSDDTEVFRQRTGYDGAKAAAGIFRERFPEKYKFYQDLHSKPSADGKDQPSPQGAKEATAPAVLEPTDSGFNFEESRQKVNDLLSNLDTRPFEQRMREDLGIEMPERADTEVEWYRLYSDIGQGLIDRGIPEDKVWNTARLMLENNGYPMPDPPKSKDSEEGEGSRDDGVELSDEEMGEWSEMVGEMDGGDQEEYETIMAAKEQEPLTAGAEQPAAVANTPSRSEQLQAFRQKMKEKHPKEPEEKKTSITSQELQKRIDFIEGNNSFRPDSINAQMIKMAGGALKEIERFFPKRGEKENFLLGTMNQILGSQELYQKLDNAQDFAASMRERFSGDQLVAQGLFGPKMEKQIWLLFRLLDPNTKLNVPPDGEKSKTIGDVGTVETPRPQGEAPRIQANKPLDAAAGSGEVPDVEDMGAGEDDFVEEAQSSNTGRRSRIAENVSQYGFRTPADSLVGGNDAKDGLTFADVAQFRNVGAVAEKDYSRYQRAVDAAASALKKPDAGQTSV